MRASLAKLGALAVLSMAFGVGCGRPELVAPGLEEAAEARAAEIQSGTSEPNAGDLVLLIVASARQDRAAPSVTRGPSQGDATCLTDVTATTPLGADADIGVVATSPDPAPEAGDPRPRGDGSTLCPMGFYAYEGSCELEGSGLRLWGVAISPDPAPEKNQ